MFPVKTAVLMLFCLIAIAVPCTAQPGNFPGNPITALAIDPAAPSTLYAGTAKGVYKSTDGAGNWAPVWTSINVTSLAVDPNTKDRVYAVAGNKIFRTDNAGSTWEQLGSTISGATVLVVDPKSPSTLYIGTTGGTFVNGSAYKSSDGGANWTSISYGLSWGTPAHIEYVGFNSLAVDPQTSTLYGGSKCCGGDTGSIITLAAGATTWQQSSEPSPLGRIGAIVLDPSNPSVLYAAAGLGSDLRGGVIKSTDRGSSWAFYNSGLPARKVVSTISVDPVTPSTLYAGLSTGIYKSIDSGANWTTANTGFPAGVTVSFLAVDPLAPATVYAGTALGVYKSLDGGGSWLAANSGLNEGLPISPPVLSGISPGSAMQDSILDVVLTGTGFVSPFGIDAGSGITVSNLLLQSSTSIAATFVIAPSATVATRVVRVMAANGTSSTLPFGVMAAVPVPPTLSGISPASSRLNRTRTITLTGTNFTPSMTVDAGNGIAVSFVNVTSTTTATAVFTVAPYADANSHNVTVITTGGTSNAASFVVIPDPPDVTDVSPSAGLAGQSVTVRLNGTKLELPLTFSNDPDIAITNITTDPSGTSMTAVFTIALGASLGAHNLQVIGAGGPANFKLVVKSLTRQSDFNGDGNADLLWYNAATGQTAMWLMNGTSVLNSALLFQDPNWKVTATADFNGDGKADLLWYNAATGQTSMWLMNGTAASSSALLFTDFYWKVTGTDDFNEDGKTDLLWNNAATGQTAMWLMDGSKTLSFFSLYTDPNWKVTGTADFDGAGFNTSFPDWSTGVADLLWYNSATGETAVWLMYGNSSVLSSRSLLAAPDWKTAATPDLDGDGKADLLWYNAATGETVAWTMKGAVPGFAGLLADTNWKVSITADLDGDAKSDLLWYNAATGQTVGWLMDGLKVASWALLLTDSNWKVTSTADFNGDARMDLVWSNAASGETVVWLMNGLTPFRYASLLADPSWKIVSPSK